MKPNIALLVCAFLGACASAPAAPPLQEPIASQADVPRARAALKRTLKDPGSVIFGGETLKPGAVCGLVNSKNSLGGYVGDTPYLYMPATGEVFVLQPSSSPAEHEVLLSRFERYCRT